MDKTSCKTPTALHKTLSKVLGSKVSRVKEVAVMILGTTVFWHHRNGDDLAPYTSVRAEVLCALGCDMSL